MSQQTDKEDMRAVIDDLMRQLREERAKGERLATVVELASAGSNGIEGSKLRRVKEALDEYRAGRAEDARVD